MWSHRDSSLPVWLLIVVVLLGAACIALILLVVWRKCLKQPRGLESYPPGTPGSPVHKVFIEKGQLVRASHDTSLTGTTLRSGWSVQHCQHLSRQCPESTFCKEQFQTSQRLADHCSTHEVSSPTENYRGASRWSWSDLLRVPSSASWRTSRGRSFDEENPRFSYRSDSVNSFQMPGKTYSKPKLSNIQPLRLDCPAPLSPITPLTIPRAPRYPASPALLRMNSKLLSEVETVPQVPANAYQIAQHRQGIVSRNDTKRRSRTLDQRLSAYCGFLQSSGYRTSSATTESFLKAWYSSYCDWLARPETSSAGASANPDMPTSSHLDMVSITDISSKNKEHEVDISLPSLTPIGTNQSISPIPPSILCSETVSIQSNRIWNGANTNRKSQTTSEEISWLVDH